MKTLSLLRTFLPILFLTIARVGIAEQTLSLQDTVKEALAHNFAIRAASEETTAAAARITQKGSLEDPMLTVKASNYPNSSFSPRQYGMTGNEVMISQKVPFPGKLTLSEQSARGDYDAQNALKNLVIIETIQKVKDAYLELSNAWKLKELIETQINLLSRIHGTAAARYAVGNAEQPEVIALSIRETTLKIEREEIKSAITAKKAELEHLLGWESPRVSWRPEPIKKSLLAFSSSVDREGALSNHPKLTALAADAASKLNDSELKKLNHLPDLEFGVGYMQRSANSDDSGEDFITAQVSMNLPFFEQSRKNAEKDEAQANAQLAKEKLEESRAELRHMVHETAALLQEKSAQLALYEKQLLPRTEGSIRSALKSFEAGETDFKSLLELMTMRYEAQKNYQATLLAHEHAAAKLEFLIAEEPASSVENVP